MGVFLQFQDQAVSHWILHEGLLYFHRGVPFKSAQDLFLGRALIQSHVLPLTVGLVHSILLVGDTYSAYLSRDYAIGELGQVPSFGGEVSLSLSNVIVHFQVHVAGKALSLGVDDHLLQLLADGDYLRNLQILFYSAGTGVYLSNFRIVQRGVLWPHQIAKVRVLGLISHGQQIIVSSRLSVDRFDLPLSVDFD